MSNVVVVGLGYVGLPLSVRAAEVGFTVIGVDSDIRKVQALAQGLSYVEDVSSDRVADVTARGAFTPRLTYHGFEPHETWEVGIITVPTPVVIENGTKVPDLSYIKDAARFLGTWMQPGATVVLESTTYPGTTEEVVIPLLEEYSRMREGIDFHVGFSPERIDPSNEINTFTTTPKIVAGTSFEAQAIIAGFYSAVVDTVVPVSTPRTAEMAKIFENTFCQVNIALVNELAVVCSKMGLDVNEVLDAAATKGHAFMRFRPGPGVGGHCIPVDPLYLTWKTRQEFGVPFRFAELADEINSNMPKHVVGRANELLDGLHNKRVLVLGLAYKAGVSDVRESPAIEILRLLDESGAVVSICDPHVGYFPGPWARLGEEEAVQRAGEFDLVVIVTNHQDVDYEALGVNARLVLDTRNQMKTGRVVGL